MGFVIGALVFVGGSAISISWFGDSLLLTLGGIICSGLVGAKIAK